MWLISVMLMAVAGGGCMWWVRQTFVGTPLQQFYLSAPASTPIWKCGPPPYLWRIGTEFPLSEIAAALLSKRRTEQP